MLPSDEKSSWSLTNALRFAPLPIMLLTLRLVLRLLLFMRSPAPLNGSKHVLRTNTSLHRTILIYVHLRALHLVDQTLQTPDEQCATLHWKREFHGGTGKGWGSS